MNKDEFLNMDPDIRVKAINSLLETTPLNEIAKVLKIPYSTFLQEMTTNDYAYIKRDKKYYKYLRGEIPPLSINAERSIYEYTEELSFLKNHLDILKKITSNQDNSTQLILNKQVYDANAKFTNKNIKVNVSIYKQFVDICDSSFHHLKIQDLISQALLEFIHKYSLPII